MELLQAIDGFQSNLASKGILCEEFLEALDIQEEEKNLKFDFLTSLHSLRTSYKGKMEDYKKKVQKKKEQKPAVNQKGQAAPQNAVKKQTEPQYYQGQ
mmetsp:Transcript_29073/g.28024  ORF Transcript_29073/g.28024 Transcript_29073/m.28024 type:complete len:98 (-) Transcript_29073:1148-1441(-)